MNDDALHAPAIGKIVDVIRAEIGRDRIVDILEGDAERTRFLAIDRQVDLRRGRQTFDINVLQNRTRIGVGNEFFGRLNQRGESLLRTILQTEREARRIAEIVDRRRLKRRNLGVAQACEFAIHISDDRCGRVVRSALGPILERDESLRGVHALPEEAEAGQEGDVADASTLLKIFLDAFDRTQRSGIG